MNKLITVAIAAIALNAAVAEVSIPSECRVGSKIKFDGYPHDGYKFRGKYTGFCCALDEYCLDSEDLQTKIKTDMKLDQYRETDGCFFAIPVTGATVASEIKPVVHLLSAKADMIKTPEIWTDEQLRADLMNEVTSSWEKDDDDGFMECEYYNPYENRWYMREWPTELWPDGKSVSSRFWIIVSMNQKNYLQRTEWGGDYTFRVGLEGTCEWTPTLHIELDNGKLIAQSDVWRGVDLQGVTYWDANGECRHNGNEVLFSVPEFCSGGFPTAFTASFAEAGTLYLYGTDPDDEEGIGQETLSIVSSNGRIASDTQQEIDNPWWPMDTFYDYGGSRVIRAIKISGATTLTLKGKDAYAGTLEAERMQFFPESKKSVAVEASFLSMRRFELSDGDYDNDWIAFGKVSGTGVYKVGETVKLTATPIDGEQFDHWEVLLGTIPSGTDLTSSVLQFTVTDEIAGTPEARKQIIVRAHWKEPCEVTALPYVQGWGTVTGGGKYYSGAEIELVATPAKGYVFMGWSDGATEAKRKVTVGHDDETVYFALFCAEGDAKYSVIYDSGNGETKTIRYSRDAVFSLPTGLFTNGNKKQIGWICTETLKRYDNDVMAFNLAEIGKSVTMTAIWEAK